MEAKDDEEEESEVDGEVEEKVTQSMHATCRWLWDGMRDKREHLKPQCVHKEWVRREQQKQRLTTKTLRRLNHVYAHAHVFLQMFLVTAHIAGFRLVACVSCRQCSSCHCTRVLNFGLCPGALCNSHCENGSCEVLSLHLPSVTVDRRQL